MPDRVRVATYVRGLMGRDGLDADRMAELTPQGPVLEAAGGGNAGVSADDFETLRKVERGTPITDSEAVRLEAIVLPNGLRPAFDIAHDTYPVLPDNWGKVNDARPTINRFIRGIGRLDLIGHPSVAYAGTAFVVAADLLLTNRHVAEFFVDGLGGGAALSFKSGRSGTVDLKQEVGVDESVVLRITAPVVILDTWDAALFRVASLPAGVQPLPLAGAPPASFIGRLATVVGYPALDPASDLLQQLQIFRTVFDKKRLMPGRLMGIKTAPSYGKNVAALAHDCTTLGGNSGSAVIDVEGGTVAGLHFAGEYLVANYAVPTWELARDPMVKAAGVTFV